MVKMKIKLIVLIVIISTLIAGCVQAPNQEVIPTATVTPTPAPTPKLKIMSVTLGQATILQVPMSMKVKNVGDAVAKDVYVAIIKVFFIPKNGNFTNRTDLINDVVRLTITLPEGKTNSFIDTGIPNPDYNGYSNWENLTAGADIPESKNYLGDILPGEVKEGRVTQTMSSTDGGCIYVKVAWTDDKKEYAIY